MNRVSKAIKSILPYAKPYAKYFIWGSIITLISIAFSLVGPIIVGKAINLMIVGNTDFVKLSEYLVILVAVYLLSALTQWIGSYCSNTLTQLVVNNIRDAMAKKIQKLPLTYLDSHSHGDIISRMVNDAEKIGDGILHSYHHLITGVTTIIVTIICMFTLDWRVALVIMIISPLSIVASYFIAKRCQKMFDRQQEKVGEINGLAEEFIGNQKVVKAFGYEKKAEKNFNIINKDLQHDMTEAHFISAMTNPTTRMINNIIYVGAAVLGILLKLSIGDLSSFLMYANKYTKPFNEVTTIIADLQNALSATERVAAFLAEKEELPDSVEPKKLDNPQGIISFQNVAFSYLPEKKLITNLNLEVLKGKKIAIVGPTGSGKTTIVNLLMRFYDVDKGKITLDGNDIKDYKRDDLRDAFGMVLQDTWLKADTISNNIAYGNPSATEEQIEEVAKNCYCDEFVSTMENGYNTVLADGGSNLSGGQRQLLCLARVMLSNPTMLILDEATSNIDTRRELYIQSTFDKMMKGKTTFIVAHRLSTIKSADMILVLKDGDIIEQGTHNELMDKKGFYYELYNSQFVNTFQ